MGTPFRAGLERSWVLSWISWLRNHHDQHLALGALPLMPLVSETPVAFPLAAEAALWIGWGAGEGETEEEMQLPSDREREKPRRLELRWLRATFGEGG